MPSAFRKELVPLEQQGAELADVSFGDFVRLLGEGIADAQASLDRASADLVAELAATRVTTVPRVTETIAADGTVTYEQAEAQEVSLLELGVTPTFYAFSQATVEATMDVRVVESAQVDEQGRKRMGLFAGTKQVRAERRLNRDVHVSSKFTATLVPVPSPLRAGPERTTTGPGT
jgi:hypothetical protein